VALSTLSEEYPVSVAADEADVRVEFLQSGRAGSLAVEIDKGTARVHYHGLAQACRGVGLLLGLADEEPGTVAEATAFETLGLMIDCSRNAVMTVSHVKKWLRRMALAGYNMLMLYTEDTYRLSGEPFFGHLRGPYTIDEIREIDDYAAALGIEIIPCIQTLGHLEQILKWGNAYGEVKDTSSVLLVGEPATYELIAKMLDFWSQAVRSRRVHVGMDETHDLGRGRYMDLFGYKRGFDIFNEHLDRVVGLCRERGLEPMIWSDMYFRMGSRTGNYYDLESKIPDEVAAAIPREAQLVYWDYYHDDEAFYREWIKRHRDLGFEPLMASGIWTWTRMVYSHQITVQDALPCVRACLKEDLKEMIFTMWKDDGAEVDFDLALAGVLYAAEASYNGGQVDDERWAARFGAVCKADLAANLEAGRLDVSHENEEVEINSRFLLWEDPLMGMYTSSLRSREETKDFDAAGYYAQLADDLSALPPDDREAGDLEFAAQIARAVALKAGMQARLADGYRDGDRAALAEVAEDLIPQVAAAVKRLWELHRRVWMAQNKPFGFEVLCVRYGGLILRLEEVAARVQEFLAGEVGRIDELEEQGEGAVIHWWHYKSVATGSCIL
jgi:hypothetical protein